MPDLEGPATPRDLGSLETADPQPSNVAGDLQTYADVARHMPVGMIAWRLLDLEDARTLTLSACNPAAEQLVGFQASTHLGRNIVELFPGAADTPRLEEYAELLRLGRARDFPEMRGTSATTRDRIFSVRAFPISRSILGTIFQDITDRKQSDDARARLAAIVESSDDAIIGKSFGGVITSWNPGAERMFQFTSGEAIGSPTSLFIPGSRREEESRLVERLERGERIEHFETLRRRKDGAEIEVSATLSPIRQSSGEIIGVSTIVRDITDLKRNQRALVRAKETAEAANRELESFSYSVAHDLRAPLRSIDGFSQALLEDCADKLGEEGRKYLGFVRESAQLMAQLLDDMLTLSRVTRSELGREPVNLSALARAACGRLERSDPGRLLEVVIQEGILGDGDPRLLAVLFDNLLGNAWKFTEKRSGARIEFGASSIDGRVTHFVRDNGAGFDMTYVGKLFGVFQRLHAASEFEGTGVGLATVQRIVHRHGGRVWAEGKVDAGATIYFTLGEGERST